MAHVCHAHGCDRAVPPRMLMCRSHWFSLPANVRAAVWREYEAGQEKSKRPSLRYLAVQQLAVMHTAFKPNDEGAARVCASYFAAAVRFQRAALAEGMGDPLAGLVPKDESG